MTHEKLKDVTIMLVEDDEVDVLNVQRALKKNNYLNKLYVADNGVTALEMLNGSRRHELEELPSIILLDINMPKMNGIEFLKKLREIPKLKQTIVVVLTTSDDERDIVRAYDYNVAGYVLKPVSYDDFVKTMATIGLYWENNKLPQDAAHDRNT